MQTAQELTQSALNKIASPHASPTQTTQAGSTGSSRKIQLQELVNRVFTRLEAIYPRTWRTAFSTDQMLTLAKREVATSMAKWSALPTTQAVDAAVERIKAEGGEWPPSVASLVKSLRPRPEDFGMPDAEAAFSEAIQHSQRPADHRWSHAAVREAGRATGWFDLAHASSDSRIRVLRSSFRKQYSAVVNRVMAGGEVESRALVGHDGQLNAAQIAERAGREAVQQRAEAEGIPAQMSAKQALAIMKARTGA